MRCVTVQPDFTNNIQPESHAFSLLTLHSPRPQASTYITALQGCHQHLHCSLLHRCGTLRRGLRCGKGASSGGCAAAKHVLPGLQAWLLVGLF